MNINRIRDLREDHDLTQAELARMLSVSRQAYSGYERGRSEHSVRNPLPVCIVLRDKLRLPDRKNRRKSPLSKTETEAFCGAKRLTETFAPLFLAGS